ncbi:MAG: GNAT family N-acetyltransferase [Alphaproteobacteria bacterium]|nr:GNAT family N-acetyltransferase [Alphaproteobacteria bacterium]
MTYPILETERLILRVQTPQDFPAFAQMWADPIVTRFIGGAPLSEEDAWAKFLRIAGHWALLGFGFWGIFEKPSGRRIGEAGILDVKRDIVPSFHGVPEIGWGLLPEVHGKGYATEAVAAIIAWAEGHFGRVRMVCIIDPDNAPSLRVAARSGFKEFARTTYKGDTIAILERFPT